MSLDYPRTIEFYSAADPGRSVMKTELERAVFSTRFFIVPGGPAWKSRSPLNRKGIAGLKPWPGGGFLVYLCLYKAEGYTILVSPPQYTGRK